MPKVSGRYFASTLAKLHSFKDAEHITVDENLRVKLRTELLIKARIRSGGEATSFLGNIAKFRQHLALAPTLLLLLVAVVGFSKFAVQFKKDVVVPVVPSKVEQPPKIEQKQPSADLTPVTQQTEETFKEKTQAPDKKEDKKAITGKKDTPNISQSSELIPPVISPPFVIAPTETKPVNASKPVVAPPTTGTMEKATEQYVPKYEQSPKKNIDEKPPVEAHPVETKPNVTQSAPNQTVVVPRPEPQVQPPQPQYYEEMAAPEEELKIYFKGKFSNDEQILLRNDLIPGLIKGKNVLYVNVRETPNEGFAVIEIYLANEDMETYIYDLHEHKIVR